MWRYLPNAISVARGLAVLPVFLLILEERWPWAFWVALIAGLSDLLDGWLAKRFGWQSRIGAGLDALADKLLLFGIFLALVLIHRLPLWWLALALARDLIIVVGAWFYNRLIEKLRPEPTWLGKVSTAAQISLALWVLAQGAWRLRLPHIESVMFWLAVSLTSLSGIHYIIVWAERALKQARLRS